ncbi:SBBP repeat-containing protein [Sphingomonas mucosissima]|nr:SBBP repeat-containing protein [Sphingomonas mucosissima]
MTINLSNGLVGLSMLTGANSFDVFSSAGMSESRAVRRAKALFTTAATIPPWRQGSSDGPVSIQVSAIKRMSTIIDKAGVDRAGAGTGTLPADVETAFTAYKALDRLRLLAASAAAKTTSPAERASLQASFGKGLADLQTYLVSAPSEKVNLAFAGPARRAESVSMLSPAALNAAEIPAVGIVATRDAALPGLRGNEVFQIRLGSGSTADTVSVDLSGTQQPPTLDSMANAINAAIAAIPMRNADGTAVQDASGATVPRWEVSFVPAKTGDQWGFSIKRSGYERVEIDQVGARDALMVASGFTALDAPTTTRIMRFDDPAGDIQRRTMSQIAAIDTEATAAAKLTAKAGTKAPAAILATTSSSAIATDANGFSYVVGTTSGDLGSNLNASEDLFLTKLDSEGRAVWQRTLGAAGSATGAAVSIAPNGDVVVAGTVTGNFDGAASDGDMLVARFSANGDEKFASLVRTLGSDTAHAVTVGPDGSVFVGGRTSSGSGDAFIARLDGTGRLQERRTIDSGGSDTVTSLAVGADGELLALTREGANAVVRRLDASSLANDFGMLTLGSADARALAVDASGSIAIAGATRADLNGDQINARGAGQDGFVMRIASDLSGSSVSYLASDGDDQVDSIAFMNGALYVGGRTTGAFGGARQGAVDGFVSRVDPSTGALLSTTQFGQAAQRTEPVRIAAASGGASALGALGLRRGVLTPENSASLLAQTSLRPGDEFLVKVTGGNARKVTIRADDTIATLADRVRLLTGSKAIVMSAKSGTGYALRIEAKAGSSVELIAGGEGRDALAKLGIEPQRLTTPATVPANAPSVRPGGSFGLDLDQALNISTAAGAAVALDRVRQAVSMSQTAYRSLYWDDGKAALADGGAGKARSSTSREQSQLAQYRAALTRLSSGSPTTGFSGF